MWLARSARIVRIRQLAVPATSTGRDYTVNTQSIFARSRALESRTAPGVLSVPFQVQLRMNGRVLVCLRLALGAPPKSAGRTASTPKSLDHGAAVNRKSQQGWTPLDFAASGRGGDWLFDNRKLERAARLLLEHGAQLSPPSAATLGRWDHLEKCSKQDLEGNGVKRRVGRGRQRQPARCPAPLA
jgi:hypothetical protein